MSEKVTIVFNNFQDTTVNYRIWGWAGPTASGVVCASGVASGRQNTYVVSGYEEYMFTIDAQNVGFKSADFNEDTEVSLVFGATA